MSRTWEDFSRLRRFESISIFIFLVVSTAGLIGVGLSRSYTLETHPDSSIRAFAYHMPNQGWAPLTVYFSAFGSYAPEKSIQRYEWDLDGNGSFENDATSTDGYAQYNYVKPGVYTVSLRVTDEDGVTATDSVLVSVRHPASSSIDYWTIFDDSHFPHRYGIPFILFSCKLQCRKCRLY